MMIGNAANCRRYAPGNRRELHEEGRMAHVGDSIVARNAAWSFEGDVAQTFDDHVSKSIPLYFEGHDLCAKISDYFLSDGSLCYEIGCSTGELTQRMAERNAGKDARFVGIDPVPEMIAEARKKCADFDKAEFVEGDVIEFELEPADLIVCYYTIQFIRPKFRQTVINKMYQALNWGGGLLLFEKVRANDARFQDMMTSLYTEYKLDRGYDSDEIVAKSRSLKGILEPFSTKGNVDQLKRAGFVDIISVQKYVCFEGFLAIK
jgi:tRNA (cmo5U34)-methyltransferase